VAAADAPQIRILEILHGGIPMATKPPRRIAARPDPDDWADDELLSLAEAAALMWPDGPITASTLRTAYRAGGLETTMIARKLLTTKRALRQMAESARRPARERR
jgi:hypothetical protein